MMVDGMIADVSQYVPTGAVGLILRVRFSTPGRFTAPLPCVSVSYPGTVIAVHWRNPLTRFGVKYFLLEPAASSIIAATPVVTAVAMLVPLRRRYRGISPLLPTTCSAGFC